MCLACMSCTFYWRVHALRGVKTFMLVVLMGVRLAHPILFDRFNVAGGCARVRRGLLVDAMSVL